MAKKTTFVTPPQGSTLSGMKLGPFAALGQAGLTPDMLGGTTWEGVFGGMSITQVQDALRNLLLFKRTGNVQFQTQAKNALQAGGSLAAEARPDTLPQGEGATPQVRVEGESETGGRAERRGEIDGTPIVQDDLTGVSGDNQLPEPDNLPPKDDLNFRDQPLNPPPTPPVVGVGRPGTGTVTTGVVSGPTSGSDIARDALQDPAAQAQYLQGLAANIGSPGTGFSDAFIYNGAIYSSNGAGRTVVMFDTAQNKWVPFQRDANNARDWDRVLTQGHNILISAAQNAPTSAATSSGQGWHWEPQPDGSLKRVVDAQATPTPTVETQPATGVADFTQPVDVGIGGLFWNGTNFVTREGQVASYGYLNQYTVRTGLENAGWTQSGGGGGYQWTPPANFGVKAGTFPGGGTPGPGKQKDQYVPPSGNQTNNLAL